VKNSVIEKNQSIMKARKLTQEIPHSSSDVSLKVQLETSGTTRTSKFPKQNPVVFRFRHTFITFPHGYCLFTM